MSGFHLPALWPTPADPAAAQALAADLAPGNPAGRSPAEAALIACIGGNSPYLADLARRDRAVFERLLHDGPTRIAADALRQLRSLLPSTARPEIAAGLRRAKRQVALATAVADLGGLWTLDQVTGTLSLLADASLKVATAHLLQAFGMRTPHGAGFVVLAMGKLGARELNYSSDIDLMLLYDPAAHAADCTPPPDDLGRRFIRLAADLVSLIGARDADGYVFRVDLRLRPDPGATPPAVSLPAAITYYESYGQNWERAAMTKARPVAGDVAMGQAFLDTIKPFVWRRHLDFAAIEDIHAMKRRIDRHKPAPARGFGSAAAEADDPLAALLGHDVKLGHGGIREIEFIAQTLQLVWGGREPGLRDPTTLGGLTRLADAGYLNREIAHELAGAYRLLRRVEHRLQMQADRQTHSLPATPTGFEAFALFMGQSDGTALATALLPVLLQTRASFERLFEAAPSRMPNSIPDDDPDDQPAASPSAPTSDDLPFDLDGPDLAEQLQALGFPTNAQVLEILQGWRGDRLRALRQPRARDLLRGLMPTLLQALARQRDPAVALLRFDTLLSRQSAGVHLLSLLGRNPALLGRIVTILGASAALAEHLAEVPAALEGLLLPVDGGEADRTLRHILDRQMRAAGSVEEAIRVAYPLVRGEEFRFSVAQMQARLDADAAGRARTRLAECVIVRMLDQVLTEHRGRYGVIPGGGMVVVALGKAGSREMMNGSDLDLMLVYDHPATIAESVPRHPTTRSRRIVTTPPRSIAASQYYTRLAHALIAALGAPGAAGPLYALDMRLRPSGAKGPVAVSLGAFRRYHAEHAWTWERMALTRARAVAGPPGLRRLVGTAIGTALSEAPGGLADRTDASGSTPAARMRRDAAAMRSRLARELPPHGPWDVKLRDGGLMEVEFIAQLLQLASADPRLRHPTTRIALGRLAQAGQLARADAAALIAADRFWRSLQGMLRILVGLQVPRDLRASLTEAAIEVLLRGLSLDHRDTTTGLELLGLHRDRIATTVRAMFLRLVGPIGPG